MADTKTSKPKAPQVRIDSLRGKTLNLPHAGNEGENMPFEVDEDGLVHALVKEDGERKRTALTEAQAEAILRLRHLDGAVRL